MPAVEVGEEKKGSAVRGISSLALSHFWVIHQGVFMEPLRMLDLRNTGGGGAGGEGGAKGGARKVRVIT